MFGGCPAFACAFVAGLLHLHLGDSHVHQLHDDTAAFACGALLGLSTFSAGPSAAGTVDIPIDVEGLSSAIIQLRQPHIELELVRGTLSSVVLFATPFVLLDSIFTLCVVDISLGLVREHLIRSIDLLKLLGCRLIAWVLIWMVLK